MVLTILVIVGVILKHRKRAKLVAMSLLSFEGIATLSRIRIRWARFLLTAPSDAAPLWTSVFVAVMIVGEMLLEVWGAWFRPTVPTVLSLRC